MLPCGHEDNCLSPISKTCWRCRLATAFGTFRKGMDEIWNELEATVCPESVTITEDGVGPPRG